MDLPKVLNELATRAIEYGKRIESGIPLDAETVTQLHEDRALLVAIGVMTEFAKTRVNDLIQAFNSE